MLLDSITNGFELRRNVEGAPMAIGATVLVDGMLDSTADTRFAGKRGTVTGFVYDTPREQFPRHPLVVVWVEGLGEDVFFLDELQTATAPARTVPLAA